ncbi:MAG: 8-oxo-dGTP diphosphatase [Patescibacteria group bacterium]
MKKVLTLTLVHNHPQILLGMKKRGFGAGKWNGFGGKVEPGESIEDAALREMREEAGIELASVEKFGVLDFSWKDNPEILEVHIFRGKEFLGKPKESDEMKPQWFHVNEIPFHAMWSDDKHWMPLFLANKKFNGNFVFDKDNNVLEHNLTVFS